MSIIKQLGGQTVIYGGGNILSRIVYYLLVSVLLSYLLDGQNAEFGVFGWFYNYAAIFIILFSFRMDTALFRFGSNTENRNNASSTSFTAVLLAAFVLLFIGGFTYKYIAQFTPVPDRPIYVRWFAFILAFDIISLVPYAKLRLDNRAKTFALFKILNVFISTILILFFLYVLPRLPLGLKSLFPDYPYLIDYVFISNLIASFTLLILLLIKVGGLSFKIDRVLLKKMMFYVTPLVIVGVANSIIQYFAVPLIEQYIGKSGEESLAEAGTYDLSRRIANLFAMFITAFNYAAEPFFFKNASASDRHLYYGKICHLFSLIGGLIILCMVFSLDAGIQFMMGESFREGIFVIPILLMGYLFLGLYYNIAIWYKLSDNTKYGALISICGVAIFLAINIIFLPIYGYVVTAWATLITYSFMVGLAYIIGQKKYPIEYPVKKLIINIFIISIGVVISVYLKPHISAFIYYTIGVMTVCLYVAYAYKAEQEEWNTILKIRKT
jgi:O-antigen/teichoic acid export membrane protein